MDRQISLVILPGVPGRFLFFLLVCGGLGFIFWILSKPLVEEDSEKGSTSIFICVD
jgi:hypothetical protein